MREMETNGPSIIFRILKKEQKKKSNPWKVEGNNKDKN